MSRLFQKLTLARHKFFLRNYFRRAVLSLPAAQRRRESRLMARRLSRLPAFRRARTVALYLSLPHEPNTAPLLRLCRQHKKRVAVPAADPASRRLRFVLLPPARVRFSRNAYGIAEPAGPRVFLPPQALDLAVVPGRAFTPRGDRLGSGGGYYDRFLKQHPRLSTIALAHSVQLTPSLPLAPHDRRVAVVVTPSKVFR